MVRGGEEEKRFTSPTPIRYCGKNEDRVIYFGQYFANGAGIRKRKKWRSKAPPEKQVFLPYQFLEIELTQKPLFTIVLILTLTIIIILVLTFIIILSLTITIILSHTYNYYHSHLHLQSLL